MVSFQGDSLFASKLKGIRPRGWRLRAARQSRTAGFCFIAQISHRKAQASEMQDVRGFVCNRKPCALLPIIQQLLG